MGLFGKLKLLLAARKAAGEVEKGVRSMDWRKTAGKGIRDFVVTTGAVAGAAVLTYLADAEHVKLALGSLPVGLRDALIPLISAVSVMALNWMKHREGE